MGQKIRSISPATQEGIYSAKQAESFSQQIDYESQKIFNPLNYSRDQENKSKQPKNYPIGLTALEKQDLNESHSALISEQKSENDVNSAMIFIVANLLQLSANEKNIENKLEKMESDIPYLEMLKDIEDGDLNSAMNQMLSEDMNSWANSIEETVNIKNWGIQLNNARLMPADSKTKILLAGLNQAASASENCKIQNFPNNTTIFFPLAGLISDQTEKILPAETTREQEISTFMDQKNSVFKNSQVWLRNDDFELFSASTKSHETQKEMLNSQAEGTMSELNLKSLFHFSEHELNSRPAEPSQMFHLSLKTSTEQNEDLTDIKQHVKNVSGKILDGNIQATKDSGNCPSNLTLQCNSVNFTPNTSTQINSPERQPAIALAMDLHGVENKILNQVFSRLHTFVSQGTGNWTINLYPPELGRLKVKIISGRGNLDIHLKSHNHQVVGILDKHLPVLQNALEQQGVELSSLQVSVDSGDQGGGQFEAPGFNYASRNKNISDLDEEDNDIVLSVLKEDLSGYPQGLNLRI